MPAPQTRAREYQKAAQRARRAARRPSSSEGSAQSSVLVSARGRATGGRMLPSRALTAVNSP
jgi:hypothetical protein